MAEPSHTPNLDRLDKVEKELIRVSAESTTQSSNFKWWFSIACGGMVTLVLGMVGLSWLGPISKNADNIAALAKEVGVVSREVGAVGELQKSSASHATEMNAQLNKSISDLVQNTRDSHMQLTKNIDKNSEQIAKLTEGVADLRATVQTLTVKLDTDLKRAEQHRKDISEAVATLPTSSDFRNLAARFDEIKNTDPEERLSAALVVTKPQPTDGQWCMSVHVIDPRRGKRVTFNRRVASAVDNSFALEILDTITKEYGAAKPFSHCERSAGQLPEFVWKDYSFCFRSPPIALAEHIEKIMGKSTGQVAITTERRTWQELVYELVDLETRYKACSSGSPSGSYLDPVPRPKAMPTSSQSVQSW